MALVECEQCGARYRVADDKTRDRLVRSRCKRCGNALPSDRDGRGLSDAVGAGQEPDSPNGTGHVWSEGLHSKEQAPGIGGGPPPHPLTVWGEEHRSTERPPDPSAVPISVRKPVGSEADGMQFGVESLPLADDEDDVSLPDPTDPATQSPGPGAGGSGSGSKGPVLFSLANLQRPAHDSASPTGMAELADLTPPRLFVDVRRQGRLLGTQSFERSPVRIGALSSSDLCIQNDPHVSKMHAVLEHGDGGRWTVLDLGSKTGIQLNGELASRQALRSGDILRLGSTELVCTLEGSELSDGVDGVRSPRDRAAGSRSEPRLPSGRVAVCSEGRTIGVHPFDDAVHIGSFRTCDIRLEGEGIDILQASLYLEGLEAALLTHRGTASVTRVNGDPVEAATLGPGDIVEIGRYRLVVVFDATEWFAVKDGEQTGPWSLDRLLLALRTSEIDRRTFVWHSGAEEWRRVEELEAISAFQDATAIATASPDANDRPAVAQETEVMEVFISFKNTDAEGKATRDSELAREICTLLTDRGIGVFMSSVTLQQLGESDYAAAIDEAIDAAKVMVVVLCRAEYASAKWVKYEWRSFFSEMLEGRKPGGQLFSYVDLKLVPVALRQRQSFQNKPGEMARLHGFIDQALKRSG